MGERNLIFSKKP